MHGCSYPAEVQAASAPLRHPNLTTMIPRNGPGIGAANGRYRYWSGFKGGVLDFAASLPWYFSTGSKYSLKPPPGSFVTNFHNTAYWMKTSVPE